MLKNCKYCGCQVHIWEFDDQPVIAEYQCIQCGLKNRLERISKSFKQQYHLE